LPEEERLDLTHLPALAIDDKGNQEPDDALSLEGDRLWVHVADVAALVPPESAADLEARARGATLYLPEGAVPMLPWAAIGRLGLGLSEISPALSFGLDLDAEKGRFAYCGDSPNDEPMFGYFPISVAVNNVLKFVDQMQTLPAYITSREGGEGFAEFVGHILRDRRKV
jgi:hypothetical protein